MPAASVPMYAPSSVAQQLSQVPHQTSPSNSSNPRPSPPMASMPRHHATLQSGELGVAPSISQYPQGHNTYNTHYTQTVGRSQIATLTRYQQDDNYQMTPELLEEIERADQQSQTHTSSPAFSIHPHLESTTPSRDQNLERFRAGDRASPKELESRRPRDPVPARESPVARQPHSPSTFVQAPISQPDRNASDSATRSSPMGGGSSGDTYTPYITRDRRATVNSLNSEPRAQYSHSTHTPPLQAVGRSSADRSLPVQEEPEDDPHPTVKDDPWNGIEQLDSRHPTSSPIPSSDTHPEGNSHRPKIHHSTSPSLDNHSDDEGVKTPRSPSVGLPERNMQPATSGIRMHPRTAGRTGSMDQVGLRGIAETIRQTSPQNGVPNPSHSSNAQRSSQLSELRKLSVDANVSLPYYASESSPYSRPYSNNQFLTEEYYGHDPSTSFYHDPQYDHRTRPEAPVPPTPHSHTAASSPSPFPPAYSRNVRNITDPRPTHAGSPYPAPYDHIRRNINISRNTIFDPNDPNFDMIREQVANQWQTFAQNTHALGGMSDSTFSPSATPFQGNFSAWAHLHARRTINGAFGIRSLQSSPGLEPPDRGEVPSAAPSHVFRSKKKTNRASRLSTEISRKTPPRVQSTQPRETSPEPSTSGEETAGEENYAGQNTNQRSWGNGSLAGQVVEDDGDGDWIDEDEEPDEDDLLELEYHPLYIKNVAKRRRRWTMGWENLLEAVGYIYFLLYHDDGVDQKVVPRIG